jgi:hypothetical protein
MRFSIGHTALATAGRAAYWGAKALMQGSWCPGFGVSGNGPARSGAPALDSQNRLGKALDV